MSRSKVTTKTVYIVILNYKNYQDTINCLESLRQSDYGNARIVVVDNDSQNESLESIAEALDEWGEAYEMLEAHPSGPTGESKHLLVQAGANRGYSAGNNVGLRVSLMNEADYALILNNDTIVPKNFVTKLLEFAEKHPDAGVVGPKVIDRNGNVQLSCARRKPVFWDHFFVHGLWGRLFKDNHFRRRMHYCDEYDYSYPKVVDIIAGCSMLIRREVMEEIGLLDETPFLFFEELILCEKLAATKYRTYIAPQAEVRHLHGAAIRKNPKRSIRKINGRSAYYYLRRYRSYGRLKAWLAVALRKRTFP